MSAEYRQTNNSLDNHSLDWIPSKVRWAALGAVLKGADLVGYIREILTIASPSQTYTSERPSENYQIK